MSQHTTTSPVAIPRHVVAVHGSLLGRDLQAALFGLGYAAVSVKEAIDHIGVHGTAADCQSVDAEDVAVLEDLIIRHTGAVESDPAVWPAWTDADCWTSDDDDDEPTAMAPLEPLPPFEPSHAERLWVASNGQVDLFAAEAQAVELMTVGLVPHDLVMPAISGGSPTPTSDLYPTSWSQPVSNYTDADQLRAFGCV